MHLLLGLLASALVSVTASFSSCAELAKEISSGQFQRAIDLLPQCVELTQIENQINEIKFKLNELTSKVSKAKTEANTRPHIEPALQWAQSPDSLYINVKFAHKIDAPACIDLINVREDIEANRISVTAACDKTGAGKHYKLDLLLFSEIDPKASNWTLTSVGRGSFQLKKRVPQTKWDRLLSTRDKPKNVHLWWAMQEKFDEALAQLNATASSSSSPASETEKDEEEVEDISVQRANKVLLADAAKQVKSQVEKVKAERKAELQAELDLITEEEQRKKRVVEEALKQLLAEQGEDAEKKDLEHFVQLFQAKLGEKGDGEKQEL